MITKYIQRNSKQGERGYERTRNKNRRNTGSNPTVEKWESKGKRWDNPENV